MVLEKTKRMKNIFTHLLFLFPFLNENYIFLWEIQESVATDKWETVFHKGYWEKIQFIFHSF